MKKRNIRRTTALLLALSLGLTSCSPSMTATTMELSKTEGTVNIHDGKQKEIEPAEQLGLYSGYQVGTEQVSYAWINLDKVKLTKMDAESEIEIKKKNNDLEIMVNAGKLFFHITEPLEDDERLNIRTSSMIVGIRGTCGWVEAWEQEKMRVYILEGTVACRRDQSDSEMSDTEKSGNLSGNLREKLSLQNILRQVLLKILPSADEEIYISAGEMAELTYSPEGEEQIIISKFTVSDIPAYIMDELLEDDELQQKIFESSGLDIQNQTPEETTEDNSEQDNPGEDNTGEASFFMKNTRYYGDPDACRLTHSQAGAFADALTSAVSQASSFYEQDRLVTNSPFQCRAALFDAGNGIPAVFFSSGTYGAPAKQQN